jgi:WS/DGAT/MGAT family acyltransferase
VPISAHKRFVWRREPLDAVKAIKDAAGVSLNDVVLAAVAGALRRHLGRRGVAVDGLDLRVFVPVATRSAEQRGRTGNQVTGLTVGLPVGERDPAGRLRTISMEMDERKGSSEPIGGQALTELVGFAVPGLLSQASRLATLQRVVNLVVTNVPGPQQPLYLLGRRLEYIAPMVPLGGNLALGVAIVSYHGTITFGFFGDWTALYDLDLLADDLVASLEELAEVSGAKASELSQA